MKKLELLKPGTKEYEEIVKKAAKPVELPLQPELRALIKEMIAFIKTLESPYGKPAGLAAPQVGIPLQIVLIQIPEEAKQRRKDVFDTWPLTVLINPSYQPIVEEGRKKDWDGCYSIPDSMGESYRYFAINYQAYTLREGSLAQLSGVARGFLARAIQHETDHLQGKLFTELVEADCRFGPMQEIWELRLKELAEAKGRLNKSVCGTKIS